MNWFERYGIVGTFFVAMTAVWFFGLFPDSFVLLKQNSEFLVLVKYIAGFLIFAFLPIGYLIVILGQWVYYRQRGIWMRIHCRYWDDLHKDIKKEILDREKLDMEKDLSQDEQNDEAKIEAVITYYDRTSSSLDVDTNKYLSAFGTKRYDVIAINRGFTLVIPISLICAICLKLFSLNINLMELRQLFLFVPLPAVFVIFIVLGIWLILSNSSSILEHQIIEIGKRKHRKIKV